jgi:hypothetical protein
VAKTVGPFSSVFVLLFVQLPEVVFMFCFLNCLEGAGVLPVAGCAYDTPDTHTAPEQHTDTIWIIMKTKTNPIPIISKESGQGKKETSVLPTRLQQIQSRNM